MAEITKKDKITTAIEIVYGRRVSKQSESEYYQALQKITNDYNTAAKTNLSVLEYFNKRKNQSSTVNEFIEEISALEKLIKSYEIDAIINEVNNNFSTPTSQKNTQPQPFVFETFTLDNFSDEIKTPESVVDINKYLEKLKKIRNILLYKYEEELNNLISIYSNTKNKPDTLLKIKSQIKEYKDKKIQLFNKIDTLQRIYQESFEKIKMTDNMSSEYYEEIIKEFLYTFGQEFDLQILKKEIKSKEYYAEIYKSFYRNKEISDKELIKQIKSIRGIRKKILDRKICDDKKRYIQRLESARQMYEAKRLKTINTINAEYSNNAEYKSKSSDEKLLYTEELNQKIRDENNKIKKFNKIIMAFKDKIKSSDKLTTEEMKEIEANIYEYFEEFEDNKILSRFKDNNKVARIRSFIDNNVETAHNMKKNEIIEEIRTTRIQISRLQEQFGNLIESELDNNTRWQSVINTIFNNKKLPDGEITDEELIKIKNTLQEIKDELSIKAIKKANEFLIAYELSYQNKEVDLSEVKANYIALDPNDTESIKESLYFIYDDYIKCKKNTDKYYVNIQDLIKEAKALSINTIDKILHYLKVNNIMLSEEEQKSIDSAKRSNNLMQMYIEIMDLSEKYSSKNNKKK